MRGQPGFFDIDDRLKRLSDLGDQLEAVFADSVPPRAVSPCLRMNAFMRVRKSRCLHRSQLPV
jgi:hypothetical protein